MPTSELLIAASIALLIVGVSKGGFGGGLGMLAVPIISLVETPVFAAAILLPVLCFMDLIGLWFYRGSWDRRLMLLLIPAAIIGIILGSLTFSYINPLHIKLAIGIISVSFALFRWYGHLMLKTSGNHNAGHGISGVFYGGIAGFTSFVAHAGGPPISMYLLPMKLDKSLYQGTAVIFFIIVNYIKLIPYFMLGLLSAGNLKISLVLFPMAVVGMLLGVYLHRRVSAELFYRVCYWILFLIGWKLIYDGIAPVFR